MTDDRFIIYFAPGSGGNFLHTIFSLYRNRLISDQVYMQDTGSFHIPRNGFKCFDKLTHDQFDLDTGCKKILIDFDETNVKKIVEMNFKKFHQANWNKQIYDSHKSDSWPPYTDDLIYKNNYIKDDIRRISCDYIRKLRTQYDTMSFDYKIHFNTVMGLDSNNLNEIVAKILDDIPSEEVSRVIDNYQKKNKELYGLLE